MTTTHIPIKARAGDRPSRSPAEVAYWSAYAEQMRLYGSTFTGSS